MDQILCNELWPLLKEVWEISVTSQHWTCGLTGYALAFDMVATEPQAVAKVDKENECLWGREKKGFSVEDSCKQDVYPFQLVATLNHQCGLCFVLFKSSHTFTCFPMVSHTFSYAYFFNVLASTNVQASDVLQHPHKQLYRTAFHYQPAKNWMNGKPTCSVTLGDDVKYAPLIYILLMNFSAC